MLVGVVGKPNCGKSTFFKAATLADIQIANYPFTTIKPNHGTGYVRVECVDKEFNLQCKPKFGFCKNHIRFVPIDMIDVAGLVPGAHEGKGMGNQFLSDLNQADVLIHVIDISGGTNDKGESVQPLSYDPTNDLIFLEEELDYWYLGILKKGWEKFAREIQQTHKDVNKELGKQLSGLGVTEKLVEETIKELRLDALKIIEWTESDLLKLASKLRIATKPMIIACNKIDVPGAENNFEKLKKEFPNTLMIPCSSESELALREAAKHQLIDYLVGGNDFKIVDESKLNEKQKNGLNFIRKNVLGRYGNTGVQQILDKAIFELLKYIAVFPVENENKLTDKENIVLPDVHLLPQGITALDLAYKIHSDIGNKFSCAVDVKTKKRLGRYHILKNGDVLKIMTN